MTPPRVPLAAGGPRSFTPGEPLNCADPRADTGKRWQNCARNRVFAIVTGQDHADRLPGLSAGHGRSPSVTGPEKTRTGGTWRGRTGRGWVRESRALKDHAHPKSRFRVQMRSGREAGSWRLAPENYVLTGRAWPCASGRRAWRYRICEPERDCSGRCCRPWLWARCGRPWPGRPW